MKKDILITGASGFLGLHILKIILSKSDCNVNLLIRRKKDKSADQRGYELVSHIYKDNINNISRKIRIIQGEITKENLGIKDVIITKLINTVEEIYHCAALTDFSVSWGEVSKVNVYGTENVLEFAEQCRKIKKVNYISSAFIAGDKEGAFSENDFDVNQGFNNPYEKSKFEAELLVRKYISKGLKIKIFRPSILAGVYFDGEAPSRQMFYQLLRFFYLNLFDEAPLDVDTFYNIIPVDMAAMAIYTLANSGTASDVYHIISPNNIRLTNIINLSIDFFGFKDCKFTSVKNFDMNKLTPTQKKLIKPYLPYFNYKCIFTSKKTEAELKRYNFTYPIINEEYLKRTLNFWIKSGFLKKFDRKRIT